MTSGMDYRRIQQYVSDFNIRIPGALISPHMPFEKYHRIAGGLIFCPTRNRIISRDSKATCKFCTAKFYEDCVEYCANGHHICRDCRTSYGMIEPMHGCTHPSLVCTVSNVPVLCNVSICADCSRRCPKCPKHAEAAEAEAAEAEAADSESKSDSDDAESKSDSDDAESKSDSDDSESKSDSDDSESKSDSDDSDDSDEDVEDVESNHKSDTFNIFKPPTIGEFSFEQPAYVPTSTKRKLVALDNNMHNKKR